MRIRKKSWAGHELTTNEQLIDDFGAFKGNWAEFFKNSNPIHLEIGCGKGRFVVETAAANPDVNFVAIERAPQVIAMALKLSRERNTVNNLCFINTDADVITDIFDYGEVSRIYLNFSDPWPNRKKWAKRRLTNKKYLNDYASVFGNYGELHQKTDNRALFDYSLLEIKECGWELPFVSYDLHNSDFRGNIMTEYEQKFTELGQPICRLEAVFRRLTIWSENEER